MAFGYTGNIRKDPANAAIERNITHLADFLCPPAEWAMKLKEKGFLNSDTFDRAVNDSNTDSQKKKATLMIIDIQRCIKVNDPNAFGTLVYMTQQDQHGTAISKKLIGEVTQRDKRLSIKAGIKTTGMSFASLLHHRLGSRR